MEMDEFDVTEGGIVKHYYLRRKSDGREFTCTRFYDSTLDLDDEIIEAADGEPVTKEEEEAVRKAIDKFLLE